MLLDASTSQLVLVDYQERLMPAIFEGAAVLARRGCLRRWRGAAGARVGHRAKPLAPGRERRRAARAVPANPCQNALQRGRRGLGEWLRPPPKAPAGNARSLPRHLQKPQQAAPARGSIVIAGCEAHVCLLQTALDLIEDEFEVWVVTDACSSRTERNRDAAFDRLAGAGAELVTTEMVAFEWLRSCEHPAFKELLPLLKEGGAPGA
jgi:Amidases related to nicotinamidase